MPLCARESVCVNSVWRERGVAWAHMRWWVTLSPSLPLTVSPSAPPPLFGVDVDTTHTYQWQFCAGTGRLDTVPAHQWPRLTSLASQRDRNSQGSGVLYEPPPPKKKHYTSLQLAAFWKAQQRLKCTSLLLWHWLKLHQIASLEWGVITALLVIVPMTPAALLHSHEAHLQLRLHELCMSARCTHAHTHARTHTHTHAHTEVCLPEVWESW